MFPPLAPAALTGSCKTDNAVPLPLEKLKFAEKIPVENLETSNTKFDNLILDVLNGKVRPNFAFSVCKMYVLQGHIHILLRAQRQDSSIPAHAWSKLVLVTFLP